MPVLSLPRQKGILGIAKGLLGARYRGHNSWQTFLGHRGNIILHRFFAETFSRPSDQVKCVGGVEALSNTLFTPPTRPETSCQFKHYHTLSKPGLICGEFSERPMAASSSSLCGIQMGTRFVNGFISKNGHANDRQATFDLSCRSKGINQYRKVVACLKDRRPNGSNMIYRIFWSETSGRRWNSGSDVSSGEKNFHSSTLTEQSAGAAHDISFDGSHREEQHDNSATSSGQAALGDRTLKLVSGSCYLPHPDKEDTGGEDAHFICVEEQAIGVADGVGGWADLGVDSGQYARELMSNSVDAIQEEPKGAVDPSRVLEKAYVSTKAKGSSTACIIALTDQGVHAVNLGDSGFMIVRDGCTVFRSPVQQHTFNFTYQLESDHGSDLPSSAQVFTVQVSPGDVIIAGTDGLFDNLYNNEVTAVVVHAIRAGLGPQVTAQKIAALARQRAHDKNRQTPFSTAAQDAGYRHYGGKLDDITVVVSYVTATST